MKYYTLSFVFLVALMSFTRQLQSQQNVDTTAIKRDMEILLKKYGIDPKMYLINISSVNQSGGQTGIIFNNYYGDALPDSMNVHFEVKTKNGLSVLSVSPKKGAWTAPFVLTDSSKAARDFFPVGSGFSTMIRGLQLRLLEQYFILEGRGLTTACTKYSPLKIYLDNADKDQIYLFGDLNERGRVYLYKAGVVSWLPMPEDFTIGK